MKPYIFTRGETISLALDAMSGDPASVSGVTAKLRKIVSERTGVATEAPFEAEFTVAARAPSGDVPGGWTLTISHNLSSTLAAGNYAADARLEIAGGVVITDSAIIQIRQGTVSE